MRFVLGTIAFSLFLIALPMHASAADTAAPAALFRDSDLPLWRPRMATPALVALDSPADREFSVEMRAPESVDGWRASLANDLQHWDCPVVSAAFGRINRGTEPGWTLRCRVPASISPELFDLTISSSQGSSTQRESVSVMPTFAADFYILHLSDEQIVNDKHTDPSGQYLQMAGAGDELLWDREPVNLIHPRFCLVTGDQIDFNGALDGWNNWPNWGYRPGAWKYFSKQETLQIEDRLSREYVRNHLGTRVPYVEAPGNHDVTPEDKKLKGTDILWHDISVSFYEKYFGQRSWSFRMGDFYVLLHDWTDHKLKPWAAQDYAAASNDPSVHYRLVAQHFHTDQAFVPASCDLMLIGHGHMTKTVQSSPYYIYMDGPTFKYGTAGFFNFRRTGDGWTCDQTQTPRDVDKDVFHLFTAHGKSATVRTDHADPMNVTDRSITITNDLPESFYDGRVRFVLDKGQYTARNGRILCQYPCENGSKVAVLVKVAIPASGSISVALTPVSH